jgi:hypothetical protein
MAATLTPQAPLPQAAPGRSRLLGGAGSQVPRVGLSAIDVRGLAIPLALLLGAGLLLLAAALLVTVRRA